MHMQRGDHQQLVSTEMNKWICFYFILGHSFYKAQASGQLYNSHFIYIFIRQGQSCIRPVLQNKPYRLKRALFIWFRNWLVSFNFSWDWTLTPSQIAIESSPKVVDQLSIIKGRESGLLLCLCSISNYSPQNRSCHFYQILKNKHNGNLSLRQAFERFPIHFFWISQN